MKRKDHILSKWMKAKHLKNKGVAHDLGISYMTLYNITKGRLPCLELAYAIEIYTQGQISIYDLLPESIKNEIKNKYKKAENDIVKLN